MISFDSAHPFPGWRHFLNKASLARTLGAHSTHQARFWPETFRLPEEFDALKHWLDANPGVVMAIKPANVFGGHGIGFARSLPSADRVGRVAQRMIDPPCLIEGRKFHVRLYVVVTATGALMWHEGIVRLAPAPYDAGLACADADITHTLWHDGHPGLLVLADPLVEDVGKVRDGERGAASPAGWGAWEAGVFRSQAANPPLDFPACLVRTGRMIS
jgi:hypothetical protein